MNDIILLIAAVLPAIILCIYVFKKDRVEKEPIPLLLKLLFFGVLSCFPVFIISDPITYIVDTIFSNVYYTDGEYIYYTSEIARLAYTAADNFICIALVEELCKFVFLFLGTRKNKNFNCLFDGIIYSVFVSLGFALFENILYVFNGGIMVALLRAVLSVPGHMFFGVFMGYYYSLWHISEKAIKMERSYVEEGLLPKTAPITSKQFLYKSLLAPILAHGAYDFCCSLDSAFMTLVFIVLEIFLYVHCFGKIKAMSKYDGNTHDYALVMLMKKYPQHQEQLMQHLREI